MNQELIKVDWLKGIKVLLIAHYIPGPMAAYLLKCLGAEVIKCEPPFYDHMRQLSPFIKGNNRKMSAYFRALNAGFKSIVVDFKKEGGVEVLKDLIKASDVLIDGNRANYLNEVLGEAVSNINPDIVHIPITAYGLKGPMRDIAGHDNNVLSLAGTLSYTSVSAQGTPSIFSAQLADITSGYIAALLYDELVSLFESKDLKEWENLLHDCDCCFTRVNNLAEAVNHLQIKELGLITEVEDYAYGTLSLTGFPAGFTENSLQPDFTEPAPEPGEHTKEILKEFTGYHPEKIEKLINEKVVYTISRGN